MKINKTLIRGSIILLVMFNLSNILGFAFQLSMARLLSIAEYGVLASIFSLIYVLGIFSESIQTVITKFSSVEKENGKIKNILKRALRKTGKYGVLVLIIYLLSSIILSYLLNVGYFLLALNGLIVLAAFITPVTRGIMQGRAMFTKLGANMVVEALVKVILAVILVLFGWGVYGAVGASVVATVVAFIFSLYLLKRVIKAKEKKAEIVNYKGFSTPVLYVVAVIFIFFSLDIIIAKAVFSPDVAGMYSIASILGKTIFLGVQPISKAMFPIVSSAKNKAKGLLNHSLLMIIVPIVIALTVFFFFPDLIIKLFSGREIPEAGSILFLTGIAFSLQAVSNIVLLYKLAGKDIKNYVYLGAIVPLQIILLLVFSSSLFSFSLALIVASAIFLIGSIILTKNGKI